MTKFKLKIDQDGFFQAVATDCTIELGDKWTLENTPTKFHQWNGDEFILNELAFKADLINLLLIYS